MFNAISSFAINCRTRRSSGPRNITEGFGRYRPRENAQYVRAQDKGFIKAEDFPRHETAANRAIGTIVGYLKYLEGCDPDGPAGKQPARPKKPKRN